MSTFEIIIIAIIYLFGYGYVLANTANDYRIKHKEPNTFYVILFCILCLIWTLWFPLLLSVDIYNKLNSK